MTTSIFLARLFAVVYLVVGVSMLLNRQYYRQMVDNLLSSPGVLYIAALLALVSGFLMVTFHNVWEANWTVLITLLGWAALLKGITFLMFPASSVRWRDAMIKSDKVMTLAVTFGLVLGAVFAYFGFVA